MTKIAGSGSESGYISQRHGSADPDPDPDPHQNIMDTEHRKQQDSESRFLHIQIRNTGKKT
jgi:hypothetical protein